MSANLDTPTVKASFSQPTPAELQILPLRSVQPIHRDQQVDMSAKEILTPGVHVAIVGGGIVGVALALSLVDRKISCTVFEQGSQPQDTGGGFALAPQAVAAMKMMAPGVIDAYHKTASKPLIESKRDIFIEVADTYRLPADATEDTSKNIGSFKRPGGLGGCLRKDFLAEMIGALPDGVYIRDRRLVNIVQRGERKQMLEFASGSAAVADVVVGCDGINSKVRAILAGPTTPHKPTYTGQFVYSMIAPMPVAIAALGEERAMSAVCYPNDFRRIFHLPVANGAMVSFSAVHCDLEDWPNPQKTRIIVDKQEAMTAMAGWPTYLRKLADASPNYAKWALFDLADNFPSTFAQGRICLAGDAAHASGPHLGSGAGTGIEDALVLAELLADANSFVGSKQINIALQVYSDVRIQRGRWIIDASRRSGQLTCFMADGVQDDTEKMVAEYEALFAMAHDWDPIVAVAEAKGKISELLKGTGR